MSEEQVAIFITVGMAVFGMLICLVIGYYNGYNDAKKKFREHK